MLQPSNSGKAPTGGPAATRSFQVSTSSFSWTGVAGGGIGGGPPPGPCCAAAPVAPDERGDGIAHLQALQILAERPLVRKLASAKLEENVAFLHAHSGRR
ncbi:MAG TPA: hypothetical protein VF432_02070, partial [Thermoanaerobaculia bacterium]